MTGLPAAQQQVRPRNALLVIVACIMLQACNSQPSHQAQSGQCPQDRATEFAPAAIASLDNPLQASTKNIDAGKELYQSEAKPLACAECHGENGDGNGPMASMFEPAPRNFTCNNNAADLSEGQFFWIIKNGSIGTSMPAFEKLTDKEIWQLTMYLRSFQPKPAAIKHSSL